MHVLHKIPFTYMTTTWETNVFSLTTKLSIMKFPLMIININNNVYIDIGTSWSKEIGLQLSPIPTNTTFLSKYINDFPNVYTAFPLYLLCPGAGMKRRPLSAAYQCKNINKYDST